MTYLEALIRIILVFQSFQHFACQKCFFRAHKQITSVTFSSLLINTCTRLPCANATIGQHQLFSKLNLQSATTMPFFFASNRSSIYNTNDSITRTLSNPDNIIPQVFLWEYFDAILNLFRTVYSKITPQPLCSANLLMNVSMRTPFQLAPVIRELNTSDPNLHQIADTSTVGIFPGLLQIAFQVHDLTRQLCIHFFTLGELSEEPDSEEMSSIDLFDCFIPMIYFLCTCVVVWSMSGILLQLTVITLHAAVDLLRFSGGLALRYLQALFFLAAAIAAPLYNALCRAFAAYCNKTYSSIYIAATCIFAHALLTGAFVAICFLFSDLSAFFVRSFFTTYVPIA